MVRDNTQRRLLFDLDMSVMDIRAKENGKKESDSEASVKLTTCYHNLLRMWADS